LFLRQSFKPVARWYRMFQILPFPQRLRMIAQRAMHERKDAFLYVDNRLEGNAPSTIEAVLERLDGGIQHGPPY
jgi:hypothetical protein